MQYDRKIFLYANSHETLLGHLYMKNCTISELKLYEQTCSTEPTELFKHAVRKKVLKF